MGNSAPLAESTFVGRARELGLLEQWLARAAEGCGRLVAIAGEAGIGKTRLVAELAERARQHGTVVLWGGCTEVEAHSAYAPIREALEGYVRDSDARRLGEVLGATAPVLARLLPCLGERLPGLAQPPALAADEERTRLFDSVSQALIAIATHAPVLLVLDDLHWADDDTVALFRHLGRITGRHRVVLHGVYRDAEVDDAQPLGQALAVLRRQAHFEQLVLKGLGSDEVESLLGVLAEQRGKGCLDTATVDPALVQAIMADTRGNPFFVRSLGLHLVEEGTVRIEEGRWCATVPIEEISVPEGVRHVLRRRLARLSGATQQLLTVAATVGESFRFDVVAAVAEVGEEPGLAAVDEALRAQLIEPAATPDSYAFAHALVRQALYEELNPSRRVRLHRRIAQGMERVFGERADEYAAAIADHFHRSRTLPGMERGAAYALRAAEQAERASAFAEAAHYLRAALDLQSATDAQRPRTLAKLGLALTRAMRFHDAPTVACAAGEEIARSEGRDTAADYLAEVVGGLHEEGGHSHMGTVARRGLDYAGDRRDLVWAVLKAADIVDREGQDPSGLGIPLDTPERREVAEITAPPGAGGAPLIGRSGSESPLLRVDVIARDMLSLPSWWRTDPAINPLGDTSFGGGDYRTAVRILEDAVIREESEGKIGRAVTCWASIARWYIALGDFDRAREARRKGAALAARLAEPSMHTAQLVAAEDEWRMARDEDWNAPLEDVGPGTGHGRISMWYRAALLASIARSHARMGRIEPALRRLTEVLPMIERAPAWVANYTRITCDAAETLWLTERTDHIDVIERNLREKVVGAHFYDVMMDARLALGRLCALQSRHDEARDWFAQARTMLDEQGARPLRAITDYDEALMYSRRGDAGDAERARALLDAALIQFRAIGMPGWILRAEALGHWLGAGAPHVAASPTAPPVPAVSALLRAEGDYWTIAYDGRIVRLRHSRGLTLLARLLRTPGREIAATELIAGVEGQGTADGQAAVSSRATLGDAGELLDAPARAAYKRRVIELREELAEAEACNDSGRAERLRTELELLTDELARAVGLGGRIRRAGSHAERARVNATRALAVVLKKIAAQHPQLGEHFDRTIRTGTFCSYAPDPRAPIRWEA